MSAKQCDDIVISGLSGRFPKSNNIDEFWSNLVKGVDMMSASSTRIPHSRGFPAKMGHLENLDLFDAEFFGITYREANVMDPQIRIALEVIYEAIIDSGLTLSEVSGRRTGFYASVLYKEMCAAFERTLPDFPNYVNHHFGLAPFIFDIKGPVSAVDTACSSSQSVMTEAFLAVKYGLCDRAIVLCSNVSHRLNITQQFMELKMISTKGASRSLDISASGFARSEGIVAVVLEKSSSAHRCYMKIVNSKTNTDGFKEEGITYPSIALQTDLLKNTYSEVGVNPELVDYIEGHLTGTQVGDFVESETIYNFFAQKRSTPLLVGCLKSNLGHTEGCAGLSAAIKDALIFKNNLIPGNLHFHQPNPKIKGLFDGKLCPVTTNTAYNGKYIGMETFGFGGANSHTIFERFDRKSSPEDYILSFGLPRLVCLQARNYQALKYFQQFLQTNQHDLTRPFLHLLNRYAKKQPFLLTSRGYTIISADQNDPLMHHYIGCFDSKKKPTVKLVLPPMSDGNIIFDENLSMIPFWNNIVASLESAGKKFGISLNLSEYEPFQATSSSLLTIFSSRIILVTLFKNLGVDVIIDSEPWMNKMLIDFFGKKQSFEALFATLLESHVYHKNSTKFSQNFQKTVDCESSFVISIGFNLSENYSSSMQKVINLGGSSSKLYLSGSKFLQSLGELYCCGIDVETERIYPKVLLPVPIDTLSLHSIFKWDHTEKVEPYTYPETHNAIRQFNRRYSIDIKETEYSFLMDHKIDGSAIFPGIGYLMLAWNAVAEYYSSTPMKFPIVIKDIKFKRATFLTENVSTLYFEYIPEIGRFSIKESGNIVASGSIFPATENETDEAFEQSIEFSHASSDIILDAVSVYKELLIRGYDYGKNFKGIHEADEYGRFGKIVWKDPLAKDDLTETIGEDIFFRTWIPFADCVLQLILLSNRKTRKTLIPISIASLICDPRRMLKFIKNCAHRECFFKATYDIDTELISTDGLKIQGVIGTEKKRKIQQVKLDKCQFVPYFEHIPIKEDDALKLELYAANYEALKNAVNEIKMNGTQDYINLMDFEKLKKLFPAKCLEYSALNQLINCYENSGNVNISIDNSCDFMIGNDSIYLSDEKFLIPFVSTIFSETPKRKSIIIWERNDGGHLLCNALIKFFNNLGVDASDYTVIRSSDFCNSYSASEVSCVVNEIKYDTIEQDQKREIELLVIKVFSFELFAREIDHLIKKVVYSGVILTVFMEKNPSSVKDDDSFDLISSTLIMEKMASHGWIVLQERTMDFGIKSCVGLLFRKSFDSSAIKDHVVKVESYDYSWLDGLKKLVDVKSEDRIWLVSDEKDFNGLAGFRRCLAQEPIGDRVHCLANRSGSGDFGLDFTKIDFNSPPFDLISKKNLKMNFYDSEHGWGDYNFFSFEEKLQAFVTKENVLLQVLTPGDLTSLTWTEFEIDENDSDKIIIDVDYVGLNFRDIMLATGRLIQSLPINARKTLLRTELGFEYSGINTKTGEKIMGIAIPGITTKVCIRKNAFMWKVPNDWSLEDAATIPIVYGTVVYALLIRGKINKGESILIHSGSGGIGISAINICLSLGCKIFTTVGTKEKREFVKKMFPSLTDSEIFNSRDTTFEEKIMRATNGQGVDIILNSLSDEKLQASLRCLAPGGRFLEIGKYDMVQDSRVELGWLDEGRSFEGICSDQLFSIDDNKEEPEAAKQISRLIAQLIDEKVIKPLPRVCFEKDEIEEAFRFMANGKHMGKVLIKMSNTESNQLSKISQAKFMKTVKFSQNKIYVIIGGFGGIGLELALWLAAKGARHLLLNSRSGPKVSYHHYCLSKLKEQGVDVVISTEDLTNYGGVQKLIKSCSLPIGGFFNSALVLHDALFMDQTISNFEKVCSPKINITANFDQVTRKHCPELEYFVVFSSIACGRGNLGQTNYGLANSFMESICEKRRRDGLHGLAIEWGAVGDVGYVADNFDSEDIRIRNTVPQKINSILSTLEKFLTTSEAIVSSSTPTATLHTINLGSSSLIKDVAYVFQIKDISSIEPHLTLADLGMDSLMGIEIQQLIERRYNLSLSSKDIRSLTWNNVINFENEFVNSSQNTIGLLPKKSDSLKLKDNNSWEHEFKIQTIEYCVYTEPLFILKENSDNSSMVTVIMPTIENNWRDLKLLANHIPGRVYGVNWVKELITLDTIEEIANYFSTLICRNINSPFNLIAASYGTIVASFVAHQLTKMASAPEIVKIVFFDCNIDAIKFALNKLVNRSDLFVIVLTQQISPDLSANQIEEIKSAHSIEDKFQVVREIVTFGGNNQAKVEDFLTWFRFILHNFPILMNIERTPQLIRPILNIRSTLPSIFFDSTSFPIKHEGDLYFEESHDYFIKNNIHKIIKVVTDFLN